MIFNDEDVLVNELMVEILSHWKSRPNAADSAEGIHRFWLNSEKPRNMDKTQKALDRLCTEGLIIGEEISGGFVYRKL